MYFSPLVKQELSRIIPSKNYEQKSELLAFIIMNGRIDSEDNLLISLDNPVMIKVVYFLVKRAFRYESKIDIVKKNNKKKIYCIKITDTRKIKFILKQFNLAKNKQGNLMRIGIGKKIEELAIGNISEKDFLRGAFLAGGFVNDPERMYHLEISCPYKDVAQMIRYILHQANFSAKTSFWQKKWTVYIKKNEQIFEFLRFIGVQRALLSFQDIIVRKDILNTVNRLVNCETANLDKTIFSASKQLFCIELVIKNIGLQNLSPNLREVIKVRLDHRYASIQELAEILGGGITKSGIYHRLKKIEQLAEGHLAASRLSLEK